MVRPSIAVAQTVPMRGDVGGNVQEHLRLIDAAANEGAQLVVFPELSLTGYEPDLANDLAFSQSDSRLAPLVRSASACETHLVVGAPVRLGDSLYIGAFLISPDGSMALYRKRHLGRFAATASPDGVVPLPEASVFEPGSENLLFEVGRRTAAIAVCKDTSLPSHAQEVAELGTRIYCASMFTIPVDLSGEITNLKNYSVRHSMVVAFANYGGPSGGLDSSGCSAIWSEKGHLLVQLEHTGAGVGVAREITEGWRTKAVMLEP